MKLSLRSPGRSIPGAPGGRRLTPTGPGLHSLAREPRGCEWVSMPRVPGDGKRPTRE